jgi:hypothetical protein
VRPVILCWCPEMRSGEPVSDRARDPHVQGVLGEAFPCHIAMVPAATDVFALTFRVDAARGSTSLQPHLRCIDSLEERVAQLNAPPASVSERRNGKSHSVGGVARATARATVNGSNEGGVEMRRDRATGVYGELAG